MTEEQTNTLSRVRAEIEICNVKIQMIESIANPLQETINNLQDELEGLKHIRDIFIKSAETITNETK